MTGQLQKARLCPAYSNGAVLGTITTSPGQLDKRRASEAAQLIQTGIPQKRITWPAQRPRRFTRRGDNHVLRTENRPSAATYPVGIGGVELTRGGVSWTL